jgi:hypothetical protein
LRIKRAGVAHEVELSDLFFGGDDDKRPRERPNGELEKQSAEVQCRDRERDGREDKNWWRVTCDDVMQSLKVNRARLKRQKLIRERRRDESRQRDTSRGLYGLYLGKDSIEMFPHLTLFAQREDRRHWEGRESSPTLIEIFEFIKVRADLWGDGEETTEGDTRQGRGALALWCKREFETKMNQTWQSNLNRRMRWWETPVQLKDPSDGESGLVSDEGGVPWGGMTRSRGREKSQDSSENLHMSRENLWDGRSGDLAPLIDNQVSLTCSRVLGLQIREIGLRWCDGFCLQRDIQ